MKKHITFNKLLLLFLIIQPFFDLVITYGKITTLIRVVIIILFFSYTIIKQKDKKAFIGFSIYFSILWIYFIFHHYNCLDFNSLVPGNFFYSSFEELLYFLKMSMPFLLIYTIYKNMFLEKDINFAYKLIVVLISGSIIITNILGISLATYTGERIGANFIMWFFGAYNQYEYTELASRGFFYFGNHIIAILLLILPIMFYIFVKKFNKLNLLLISSLLLSMILLGNKTSVFGSYMALIILFLIYILFTTFFKEFKMDKRVTISLITIGLLYTGLMYISPAYTRIITDEGTAPNYQTSDSLKQTQINYIKLNYETKLIKKQFIEEYYPYKYDPSFWYGILQEPKESRIDYRFLEIEMMNRVIEINNNPNDKWLGIGYSRHMNIFNVEKDYLNQYYSLGILGTFLFIGPYLLLIGYATIKTLYRKNLLFKNVIFLFSIYLVLIAAYFTGNLFNSLSVMIPLAYVYGILFQNLKSKKM